MEPMTKERLADRNIWVRALYALFCLIAYSIAETILTLIVIFQFFAALLTGKVHEATLKFSTNLTAYVYQILQFVTFNSETLPFPFSDWPLKETDTDSPWATGTAEPPAAETPPAGTVQQPTVDATHENPDDPEKKPE